MKEGVKAFARRIARQLSLYSRTGPSSRTCVTPQASALTRMSSAP
jgi:hypothetical protein